VGTGEPDWLATASMIVPGRRGEVCSLRKPVAFRGRKLRRRATMRPDLTYCCVLIEAGGRGRKVRIKSNSEIELAWG